MSRINFGEVVYSFKRELSQEAAALRLAEVAALPIEIISISDHDVDGAAELKSRYRFSYADAFAASLAMSLDVPVVTGDKEFLPLERDGLIRLHWLGA